MIKSNQSLVDDDDVEEGEGEVATTENVLSGRISAQYTIE